MSIAAEVQFEPFEPRHDKSAAALASALGWPSYASSAMTHAAFSAPGSVTWVAIVNEEVIGVAHILTNGVAHAHPSLVGVLPEYRRRGIAARLIAEVFARSGAKWLDLWSEPEGFYRSFRHQEYVGFRIHPKNPRRE